MENSAYIILLLVCFFLLGIHCNNKNIIIKKLCRLTLTLILIAFSGFRYYVGRDYQNYIWLHERIIQLGFSDCEVGHYLVVRLVDFIGGTAQLVFLFYATITVLFISKFINDNSESIELSWVLFICLGPFYLATMNTMRQWLAISLFLYSTKFIQKRRFKKYFLINIVGVLFHTSTLIVIPLYFWLAKEKKQLFSGLMVGVGIFALDKIGIIGYIAKLIGYGAYLQSTRQESVDLSYYVFIFLFVLYVFSVHFLMPKESSNATKSYLMYNMSVVSVVCIVLLLMSSTISNIVWARVNSFFLPIYLLIIPDTVKNMRTTVSTKLFMKFVFAGGSVIYFIYLTLSSQDLTPYTMNFLIF